MTPAWPLDDIDADITQAMTDLRYYRQRADSYLTADTVNDVNNAEDRLNALLDERAAAQEVRA